jgi:hypothetical protein
MGDPAGSPPLAAAAGEAAEATSVPDEGPGKTARQVEIEPSAEAEKKPSAGESGVGDPASSAPLAAAPSSAAADNPLERALAALDRRDYGTAKRLFESLGRKDAVEAIENALTALDRKDYPAAQALFEALALKPSASGAAAPGARTEPELLTSSEIVPVVNPVERPPVAQPVKAKKRGARRLAFAACLAVLALLGASYVYGWRGIGAFVPAKTPATASLAAADSAAAPLKATAADGGGEDERAELHDLKAALAGATARLDRIEQDFGARLDKLGEHAGQNSGLAQNSGPAQDSGLADVTARLDALEKTAAQPAQPVAGLADVEARLDRLEKSGAATAPASAIADLSARLDKLEKRSVAASAASSAAALPPPAPKRPAPTARVHPAAPNDAAAQTASKRLLPDYDVEDVQDGVAVVASRYGAQQVAPGDFIPGAGRVLRIERHGGAWYIQTSNGVIGGPAPY